MAHPGPPGPLHAETEPGGPVDPRHWLASHLISVITVSLGVVVFMVASFARDGMFNAPDRRITVPGLILTVAAAVVAIARRERPVAIPVLGVGLAATALVLGWFLMVAIVLVGTVLVVTLLHAVM